MAKLLFTAFLADARNKLNGSVFSKNRYGPYVRTRATPANPQTAYQQEVRQAFGSLSSAWRNLSDAERSAWSAAAQDFPVLDAFGNSKILSGNALFVSLNRNRLLIGQPTLTLPPLPQAVPTLELTALSVALDVGPALDVNLTYVVPNPVAPASTLVVRGTPGVSPGISFFGNRYRVIGTFTPVAGGGSLALDTAWPARVGFPAVGQKVSAEAYLIVNSTGQAGVPLRINAIVEAA